MRMPPPEDIPAGALDMGRIAGAGAELCDSILGLCIGVMRGDGAMRAGGATAGAGATVVCGGAIVVCAGACVLETAPMLAVGGAGRFMFHCAPREP
jgi:hypothetical protein